MMNSILYAGRNIRGVCLDITGVLKESGSDGGTAINGSIDAINRLFKSGLKVCFITNETTVTRKTLVRQLTTLGFTLDEKQVFSPVPAVCQILHKKNLRPHLLVHPAAMSDFDSVDKNNPNCVVVGDATHQFSYHNLNEAFRHLMALEKPILFSLGSGRYYQDDSHLVLDVGPYMKALEYATGVTAEVVGKPSCNFFTAVLNEMGLLPAEAVMVGDDVVSDVGGAQSSGMAGVLVRTGKFRQQDEHHQTIKPDAIFDNLAQFVDSLLSHL